MSPLRIAFMGSPDFAVPALRALHGAGHDVVAVYCQPPRPAGRGQAMRPCPVHVAAEELGIPVRTPTRLRKDAQAQADFAALDLDVAVIAAYGLILPAPILAAPRRGCVNIHASLLPRWRGASPIQAAILAGDTESGVTIMQMDEGLDTGAMLLAGRVLLGPRATSSWLHDRLSGLGAALVLRVLDEAPAPVAQPEDGVTYAPKLTREDGAIDWTKDTAAIDRQVRALNPWPGTFCHLGNEVLKVLEAEPSSGSGVPGTVLDAALTVACGTGALRVLRVQRAGRAVMPAEAFLRGHPLPPGTLLT
jgi:methionyl-tRNA formyltransferase